jgi:hypothetical protein
MTSLFKRVGTIDVPAIPLFPYKEKYVERGFHFEAGKGIDRGILWSGDDFEKRILPITEENVPAAILTVYELTRDAKNFRIAAELNLEERGPVALAHFYEVLFRQFNGEAGDLVTDGTIHVAFIVAPEESWLLGDIWPVAAYLLKAGGWSVQAHSFSNYKFGWLEGTRFLSY